MRIANDGGETLESICGTGLNIEPNGYFLVSAHIEGAAVVENCGWDYVWTDLRGLWWTLLTSVYNDPAKEFGCCIGVEKMRLQQYHFSGG